MPHKKDKINVYILASPHPQFDEILDFPPEGVVYSVDRIKSSYHGWFTEKKIALLVGNEHRGLSAEAIALCDQKIYIPMKGLVQSLNVSVATALSIAEICGKKTLVPMSELMTTGLLESYLEK